MTIPFPFQLKIDEEPWIVKRARLGKAHMVMLLPDVKKPPRDAKGQKIEGRIVAQNNSHVAPCAE